MRSLFVSSMSTSVRHHISRRHINPSLSLTTIVSGSFHSRLHKANRRSYHASGPLLLNRILFDTSELDPETSLTSLSEELSDVDDVPLATVTFPKDDYRTVHVAKILGLHNGDTIRAGSVRSPNLAMDEDRNNLAGLITDEATITWLPEGKVKKAEPTKNGDPPGSLRIEIPHPPKTSLWKERNSTSVEDTVDVSVSDTPRVSLLLALPRPLQLGRILPMVAQIGIDQLVLTNAKKVPKDYFGSHIFRNPEVLRGLLVEGLAQCGDVRLPNVTVTKRLKIFMEDELDEIFPPDEFVRVIAHPERKSVDGEVIAEGDKVKRMTDIEFPMDGTGQPRKLLVAVG